MFYMGWISFLVFFIIPLLLLVILLLNKIQVRCDSPVCLLGKTALVTGGSSGIGYQMVLDLAKRGCKVIIADKNNDENITKTIIRETNNEYISMESVDLASFTSVRRMAERLKQTENKLDILINNAGVLNSSNELTEDGLNPLWQINFYSGFLLTHLLAELLMKSPAGRIIFTSSQLSFLNNLTKVDLTISSLMDESNSRFHYCNTKCLNIVASDLFAKKLGKYKITSNAFHPGIAKTQIFQHGAVYARNWVDRLISWALYFMLLIFGKSANEGAQTGILLAVSREVEGASGKYFGRCSPSCKPRFTNNKPLCDRIWELSEEVVELKADERL